MLDIFKILFTRLIITEYNIIMFETLHLDVIPIIFDYLSQKDLIYIKYTNQLLYNQYEKYVVNTKFMHINDLNKLYDACSNKYYISLFKISANIDLNVCLYYACEFGDNYIINILINKGANNWNYALLGACKGNHIDIAENMINKGANNIVDTFINTCIYGKLEVIKYLINYYFEYINNLDTLNNGLYYACGNGNIELVHLLINLGANDWNNGLTNSCLNNRQQIINIMLSKGANFCGHCNHSI